VYPCKNSTTELSQNPNKTNYTFDKITKYTSNPYPKIIFVLLLFPDYLRITKLDLTIVD